MSRLPLRACAAMLAAFAISPVLQGACPDFATGVALPAGTSPSLAASGDFDGDGRRDLAVATGSSIAILLGNASGTFDVATPVSVSSSTNTILVADFDRDGDEDLAVGDDSGITIQFGNGFGAFGSPASYFAPFGRAAAAGDFDRDGAIDLAVLNRNAATLSIYINNGLGSLANSATYSASLAPVAAVAGDFNGDGALDLAVANANADLVTLHDGNGNGTFAAARTLSVPPAAPAASSEPSAIVAADFDEDGSLDLAVGAATSNRIVAYIGDGNGSFGAPTQLTTGTRPQSIVAGDFNGDGSIDLASANALSDSISILSGNGAGGFASAVTHATGDQPTSLVADDFNRDAKPDLLSTDLTSGQLSLLINSGACFTNCGAFTGPDSFGASGPGSAVASGDFDRNGAIDLVVANQTSNNVSVVLGDGDGGFGSPVNFSAGSGPSAVVVADINRDGFPDIAVANQITDNVTILLGNGSGSFSSAGTVSVGSGAGPRAMVAGDFDRDGAVDLAVSCGTSQELAILANNTSPGSGSPVFNLTTISSVGSGQGPRGLTAADVNTDGSLDLLVANYGDGFFPGSVLVYLGNGSGAFSASGSVATSFGTQAVAVGDFDRDGNLDLAAANHDSMSVTIAFGTGSGSFASPTSESVGSQPASIVVTDVNRDGNLDLALALPGGNQAAILLGSDTGSFSPASPATYNLGASPNALAAADFDGDGKDDLAAATGSFSSNLSVLLNSCPPPDLSIDKTHVGSFQQGGTGVYSIFVSNVANVPSAGLVRVADVLPAGLTATNISGSGWACTLSPLACTRSDSLGAFNSWPEIGISVNVANNAAPSVVNTATVEGGADVTPGNNSDSDPTTITQHPDLTIAKSHTGNFSQGQSGATYTIVVSNVGGAATTGTVSVSDTLPAGISATAIAGSGWTCSFAALTCTRNDALASGGSYPAITLTVSVSSTSPSPRTNVASVSGGGELGSANGNNNASDVTIVVAKPDLTIAKTHAGSFSQGQTGAVYTIVVTNSGGAATSGGVTVTDTLPSGLTATALTGTGWSCTLATLTCTRSDVLVASTSYQAITLTVNVAANATSPRINVASVSGGGEVATGNNSASDSTIVTRVAENCGRFAPRSAIALPTGAPRAVAVADFNGDGDEDIAYTDEVLNTLSILLGNGNGTFGSPVAYTTGAGPSSPVARDFDHDGDVDIVLANVNSHTINTTGTISVFLGNGNGTFAARVDYAAGHVPYSVTTGFFNADAHLDLAVPINQTNVIAIYLGNGNGTFATAVTYPTLQSPMVATVADFNGDSKADIALATGHGLMFLPGVGDGTFGAGSSSMPGSDPRAIVAGDFNGDTKVDVAVAHLGDDNVSVYIGIGDGTFAPRVNYPTSDGAFWLAGADLDGDGDIDLAAPIVGSPGAVAVLRNNGNGTFAAAVNEPAGANSAGVAIGDLNGDSRLDLVVASGGSDDLSIILSACVDLTVAKTHSGNFTQGQTGATYSIVVSNSDLLASSGTVTVTDTLPAGLVMTGISGSGWTCTLATRTCTRSESLADSSSFPPITVTVNVNSNAAATVTNVATVSGGGDDITTNNSASDPTTVVAAPLIAATRFVATVFSTTQVNLTWDAVTNATSYHIFRRSEGLPFAHVATSNTASLSDGGRTPGVTYVYHVKAVSSGGAVGAASANDLATTMFFTDDPLVPQVKAVHFTQLRTAIDAVRAAAGLGAAGYTNAIVAGGVVEAVDVNEMRAALNLARTQLAVPAVSYTDSPTVSAGTRIKGAHITDLRNGTK